MCSGRCRSDGAGPAKRVRWVELLPDEFRQRRRELPLAWLPLGLCEPHGHVAAFGLDLIKAEWLCDSGARRFGGVVAPSQGWHIHETGYHARWLEEVVGEADAEMSSLPPDLVLRTFLYQLRALVNAGFRAIIVVSGHAGGNELDLRRVAAAFSARIPAIVDVFSDPELTNGEFPADHAGRFEISQLLALRPDLVDLSRLRRGEEADAGGRLALGQDAAEATSAYGAQVLDRQLAELGRVVERLAPRLNEKPAPHRVSLQQTESIWRSLSQETGPWVTCRPQPGQRPVTSGSRWREGEHFEWSAP